MGTSKQTIVISAEVQASLTGMEQVVSKLQKGIKEGTTKLDLNKGLGASLSKNIAAFEKDYERIQKLTEGGVVSLGDTKEFTKKGQHLISIFEDIQRVVGNFDNLEVLDAKKLFPQAFDNRVKDLKEVLNGLQTSFDKLASKGLSKDTLEKDIASLEKEIGELREKASKEAELKISSDSAQANLQEAKAAIDDIKKSLKDTLNLQIATSSADIEKAKKEIANIQKKRKGRQSTKEIVDDGTHVVKYKGKSLAQWKKGPKTQQSTAAIKVLENYAQESAELERLQDLIDKTTKKVSDLNNAYAKVETGDLSKIAASIGQGTEEVDKITTALKNQEQASEDAADAAKKLGEAQTAAARAATKESQLEEKRNKLAATIKEIESLTQKVDFSRLQKAFKELDIDITPEMLKNQDEVERLQKELNNIDQAKLQNLKNALNQLGLNTDEVRALMKKLGAEIENVGDTSRELNRAEQDMARLQDQILDFFSISNTIQIFKDAIRDAFDTVKELDAAMTETAVVTDFSIGDMWDKLPEYSEEANKLGTSIKSLYEATTLYYQQGLQSNEAMGVGVETMKMARIANMDAAAATEAMTAALRGFNMEINETSATRVNDVYSELAAITAADTSQIATAMSKTASIASSANMEFETTAALLAQIIETTQEAPETAGTAMKTIIARFTEVKQLFDEGMLTGEDAEGEAIDINKIDAALKKVGISLKDFLTGQKGIDDIFLELASKWDSLDLATQRYIATTAAGSRQQSRFLAMMSNYDRTMELVTAANNSAGASQEQFNKTLDSLDAKLQKLKNAWDTFTMGLANNEVIKGAVDILTMLLEGVNNLTGVAGNDGLGGVITMFIRLGTVIGALKGGEAIIKGLIKSIAGFSSSAAFKEMAGKVIGSGGGMGLGKALWTQLNVRMGNFEFGSESIQEAGQKLLEVKKSFGAAKGGAVAFGESLAALSPYIAILIAIGAAVYGIAKSFKAAQKETKLDNINQALDNLNTEAQNVQDELGNIGSARTELKGLQDTLNGLTKGTTEWKSALVDVNRQVLELIEKYPSLEYELGANGALSIKEESWDNLLAQQQKVITNMTAQRLDLESQRANIVKDIDFEKFVVDSYGTNTAETDRNARRANRQALIKNKDFQKAILQDIAIAGAGNVYVEETEQSKVKNQLEEYLVDDQVMGQTKFEKWMAQAEMDMAQWYQNSPLLAWLADGANAASGNVYIEESETAKRQRLLNENENYYVDEVAEKLVGLNQTEMTALAAEFAREGENSQTVDQSKFIEMLETATGREWADDAAENLLNSIKEFDKATNSFNDLIQTEIKNQSSQESLARQFTMNALTGSSIMEKDYADSIVNIISKGEKEAISDQVNAKAEELEASYKNEKDELDLEKLAADYAAVMGFQAVGKEVYRDGTYSEKVDTSPEAMIRALATEAITIEVKEKAEKTAGAIGKEKEQEKLFDNLFSTDGQEITASQLTKYSNADGTLKYDDIAKDISNYDTLNEMATSMGQDVNDLTETLTSNFKIANERIATQRQNLVKNMTKFTKQENQKDFDVNADLFLKLEQKYGDKVYEVFEGAFDKLSNVEDIEFSSDAYEALRNAMMEATSTEEMEQAWAFFNSIDFNNPINALETITKEAENGTGAAQKMAIVLQQSSGSFLGLSSQITALTESAEFEEINAELTEILETNEEISATDVSELAKSYKSLDKILKQNEITAAGLGKVLEGLNKGEIQAWQLTDAVLASASAFHSLDSIASKAIRNIEEFDLGIDENTVGESVVGWGDLIQENLEKGAVGNSQNFRILDYLFPGWQKDLQGEALINEMDRLSKLLQGNGQNLRQMWSDIGAGKDFQGKDISLSEENQAMGLSVRDTGEEIFFEGWEGKNLTSADLVSWISDAYNVSTELAEMMLTDFKNYSEDLAKELAENDYATGIEKAYNNLNQIGDIKLVDESEIEALSKIWNKDADTIRKELQERGVQVTDFYDEDGNIETFQNISEQMNKALGGGDATAQKWTQSFENEFGAINLTKFEKELEKAGITGLNAEGLKEQAFNAYRDAAAKAGKDVDFTTMVDGKEVKIPVTPEMDYDTFQQNLASEVKKAENEALAESIGNATATALKEGSVALTIDESTILYFQEQIKTAAAGATAEVPLTISEQTKAEMQTTIAETAGAPQTTPVILDVVSSDIGANTYARTVPIYLKVVKNEIPGATGSGTVEQATEGSSAKGVKKSPKAFSSLVSEEGPELIQKASGETYLTGQNGPEIAMVEQGDTVYTAEETKEIFKKRNHVIMPSFARGYGEGSAYEGVSGGRKGTSKTEEEDKWENPFDKLYNLVRKIDEELRERERIERRYEKLLEGLNASANKIINVSREELAQLEKERMLQEQLVEGRTYQINKYQEENSDLQQYARVMKNDRGESILRIDWDKINTVTDTEKGDRIEAYVSQLEEWFGSLEEAEDALWEIEDTVAEIKERGEDEYFELEEVIKDALTQTYQDQIDKLNEINTSINDTNSSLLDAIQTSIDKQRQDRDNQRTEDELAEKQRRLLYLQQDTSGANALEILKLQDEIEQGQEDYTDTLIDQKISELQRQNDEAAKQREKQITLLQAQLDHYIEFGEIWDEVYSLMESGLDENNGLIRGSRLETILKNSENFGGLSAIGQQEWWKEMNTMIAEALAYLELGRQLEDIGVKNQEIEIVLPSGQTIKGTVDDQGNVTGENGQVYNNVWQGIDGRYYAGENTQEPEEPTVEHPNGGNTPPAPELEQTPKTTTIKKNIKNGFNVRRGASMSASKIGALPKGTEIEIDGYKADWYHIISPWEGFIHTNAVASSVDRTKLKAYKTGGLADFTGPAWLDGTKARPEIVLDAQDSRNFVQLRDILSAVLNRGNVNTSTENNGDITYDIDINVESIGSDYDVEQVANKVKSLINEDARYRNNNAVSLKR